RAVPHLQVQHQASSSSSLLESCSSSCLRRPLCWQRQDSRHSQRGGVARRHYSSRLQVHLWSVEAAEPGLCRSRSRPSWPRPSLGTLQVEVGYRASLFKKKKKKRKGRLAHLLFTTENAEVCASGA